MILCCERIRNILWHDFAKGAQILKKFIFNIVQILCERLWTKQFLDDILIREQASLAHDNIKIYLLLKFENRNSYRNQWHRV